MKSSSIDLTLNTISLAQGGEIFVLKMGTVKVFDLIEVLIEKFAEKYNDKEKFIRNVSHEELNSCDYCCGLFWFTKE